jgi:hypothetical protein
LREEHRQRDLADVCALAGHVGAGDECERVAVSEPGVISDELVAELLFEDRVPAVDNFQHAIGRDRGSTISTFLRQRCECGKHVDPGEPRREFLESANVRQEHLAHFFEQL